MCNKSLYFLSCILVLGLIHAAPGDLVSHWKLDEGAGAVASDSGPAGNDGTLFGQTGWTTGVSGAALEFFGSGAAGNPRDYVNCGGDTSLNITSRISIALWIKPGADDPEGKGTETAPMAKAMDPDWSWQVRYGWGGAPRPFMAFTFNTSPRAWAFVGKNLERDEWCHIACSHDGTTLKCYLNGEQTDATPMGAIASNATPVLIGSDGWGSDWIGAIDDVRIYSHGISEGEVLAAMATGPILTAMSPTPRDGTVIEPTWATLKWRAGDQAQLHEVYFGDSLEEISTATPADTDVFVGRQVAPLLSVGIVGGPLPGGLAPGQTYYWRVDEINEAEPNSPWKGNVWSFRVQPVTAWNPWPLDGMKYVDPEQDLSWSKGTGTIFHQIYFGDNFEQVKNAPAPTSMNTATTYDPGPLQLDKTYYWRVDEFLGAVIQKGSVWSFTTRGAGGGVQAQYFQGLDLAGDPVLTQTEGSIDHAWSAEVAAGLSDQVSARWTANLEVPLSESYRLITTSDDGVRLWLDRLQVIDNWTDHGAADNSVKVDLVAGQKYFVCMEWYENGGGAVAQLSWESPSITRQIIPQGWLQLPLWATAPYPASGAVDTPQKLLFEWRAGEKAAQHDVYFGTEAEAVANADTTSSLYQGRQADATFDPGSLEGGKTYYWRVDEVDGADLWKGSVWSFTTATFLVVEDFEIYTDDEGNRIYETWLDGFTSGDNGSTVGYIDPPFAEQKIVHGGLLSMPLDYNNVNLPYYSEAERSWATAQNWTVNGGDTLVLFVRGSAKNAPAPLYVAVEDTGGRSGSVTQSDTAVVTTTTWTEWKIPLSQLTAGGAKANSIKKLYLGVGSKANPVKGGAGLLFIDDIRVIKAQ